MMFLKNCTWSKWQNVVTIRAKCAGPKLLQVAKLCIWNFWPGIQNIALAVFNTLISNRRNIKKHCTLPIECISRFSMLSRKIAPFPPYSINRLSRLIEIPGVLCVVGNELLYMLINFSLWTVTSLSVAQPYLNTVNSTEPLNSNSSGDFSSKASKYTVVLSPKSHIFIACGNWPTP